MRDRIWRMICSTSTLSDRTEKSDIVSSRYLIEIWSRGVAPRTPLHASSRAASPARSGRVAHSRRSFAAASPGRRPSNSPTRFLARRFAGALRPRGSLAALACHRFPSIAAARLPGAPVQELRGLRDTGAENPQRSYQRPCPRHRDLAGRVPHVGITVGVGPHRLPVAEQAPPRAVQYRLHHLLRVERIPEAVVVENARDIGPRREDRL